MEENREYPNVADYIYEIDEKGRRVLVRSLEGNQSAYVRFTNKTSRPVDVWWRNYRGVKCLYARLEPGSHYNVDTFITHPWEFTDSETREHFVICNKQIFRAPANVGGMMYRTNWNITVSIRSLRQTALLALGLRHAANPAEIRQLGLPFTLAEELRDMILVLRTLPPPLQ